MWEATSKDCHRQFQQIYKYQGANPLLKKQVCEMSMCASGIRDISGRQSAKVLKISPVTVIAILRLWFKSHQEPNFEGVFEEVIIDYASQMKCEVGWAKERLGKDGFGGRRCGMHNVQS